MTLQIKVIIWIVVTVAASGIVGGIYYKIYNDGRKAVYIEQEKKLNIIKDKAHDAQTDALTSPSFRDELRRYSRPND